MISKGSAKSLDFELFNEISPAFVYNKHSHLSIQQQIGHLSITSCKEKIVFALQNFQTLIVYGETGCGKSTQLPQYLVDYDWRHVEDKREEFGEERIRVCISQPRRAFALSLAKRIADERVSNVANPINVSYSSKFENLSYTSFKSNHHSQISVLTEDVLIRKMMFDPLLNEFSAIILDEVHERSANIDLLLSLIKKVLKKRRELRLIVSSSTIDPDLFQNYFNIKSSRRERHECSSIVMRVEESISPNFVNKVSIYHSKSPVSDYISSAFNTVIYIFSLKKRRGDILVFMPGRFEVQSLVKMLMEESLSRDSPLHSCVKILALHHGAPNSVQSTAFSRSVDGKTKIIVSTSFAETSITFPGLVYVVDSGFTKSMVISAELGCDRLITHAISQASAVQRAGRVGRTAPGFVYRLYPHSSFLSLAKYNIPEVQKMSCEEFLLKLKAFGIVNVLRFDFISPPSLKLLLQGIEKLYVLDVIDMNYPIFESNNASQKHHYSCYEGDLVTKLNIFRVFARSKSRNKHWGSMSGFNDGALNHAYKIFEWLMHKYNVKCATFSTNENESASTTSICKCITIGLFSKAAILSSSGMYKIPTFKNCESDVNLELHSDSVLATQNPPPECLVFYRISETSNRRNHFIMRDVTSIQTDWLFKLIPKYFEFGTTKS